RLHRQTHSALTIDFEHLDLGFLTLAEFVAAFFDAIVRNLRNMHQAVATGDEIDERAEVHQTHDFALVDLARFDVAGNVFDAFDGQIGGRLVDGGDINCAIIFNVDTGAGFVGNAANRGPTLADDIANFFGVDLDGKDARRPLGYFLVRTGQHLIHFTQNMQAAFVRLTQRHFHDFPRDTGNLDIHL